MPKGYILILLLFIVSSIQSQNQIIYDAKIDSLLFNEAIKIKTEGEYTAPSVFQQQLYQRTSPIDVKTKGCSMSILDDYYETQKGKTLIIARLWNQPDGQKNILYKGSAFPITKDGICVTNHHIFRLHPDKMEDILYLVMDIDGNFYEIQEILAANFDDDLAIFKLKDVKGMVPVSIGNNPKVGDEVHLISHPAANYYYYSKGNVTRSYLYQERRSKRVSITADFSVGSSGAPVCDIHGNLLGVVTSTYYLPKGGYPQVIVKEMSPVGNLNKLLNWQKR